MTIPSNWEEETRLPLFTSCKQAARLVSISIERRLTLRELITMRVHLLMCRTCSRYRRQIMSLRRIFLRHTEILDNVPPSPNDTLAPDVKARIRSCLRDQV